MEIIYKNTVAYAQHFTKTIAMIICAMIGFAQNSNGQTLTPEEQAWITEHPVVRVSNNSSYPPIDFVSAEQPAGFAVDYMRLVASKVDLKIKFLSDLAWKNTIQKLKDKELDIITIMSKNEERSQFALFTSPYIYLPIVHYGREGSNNINSIKDFWGKRIGLQSGHIIANAYQKNYPNLNYVFYDDPIAALKALSSSEIDIYTDDNVTIGYAISQYNIEGLEDLTGELEFEHNPLDQRFSVHKDNKVLLGILNKGIAAVTNEEFKGVYDKWISSNQVTQGFRLTAGEQAWLAENKVIKVSADKNSFPFDFIDDKGGLSGVTGDFLNEISKQLNVKFVWAGNESWNDGLLKIHSRDADMVSLITPTKERQSFLEFSDAYVNLKNVIISRDDSTVFSNMDTLDGRTVVQLKGTAIIGYLGENYPNIKVIETETYKEALELLSSGGADAVIENIPGGLANISKFGFENLRIVGTTPYSEALSFGISSELPLLSSAIQKALTNIDIETRSAIFTKWLTQRIAPKIDYGPLYYVIGLALFAGLIFLLWYRKLRGEILRRRATENSLINTQEKLTYALKEAQKANAAKNNFLASMSHDLRTPLNAIIGFSEALLEETFGPIKNKKVTEYIDDIHTSGKYLLHLVNDILDLSALEADKKALNYESFNGEQLILECKNIIFKLAEDKNIDITINSEHKLPNVYADRNALKQILMNVISNAIKFTPEDGDIIINTSTSDDNFVFQISDNGHGISEADIKKITNPFVRAESSEFISHEEGTGLGLSIVKSLIDFHAGELIIESIMGEGTTVTVSMPLQNAI